VSNWNAKVPIYTRSIKCSNVHLNNGYNSINGLSIIYYDHFIENIQRVKRTTRKCLSVIRCVQIVRILLRKDLHFSDREITDINIFWKFLIYIQNVKSMPLDTLYIMYLRIMIADCGSPSVVLDIRCSCFKHFSIFIWILLLIFMRTFNIIRIEFIRQYSYLKQT